MLNANASKNSYWTAQKDEVGYHKTIQNVSGEMEKTFYWASQEEEAGISIAMSITANFLAK